MKRFVALAILTTALSAACTQPADVALDDPTQRGSYAQGFTIGQQAQDLPIDADAFIAGLRDGLNDQGQLDPQQVQQAMMEFRGLLEESRRAEAEAGLTAGTAYLAENAEREGVTTTASGLQYEVLRPGDGPRPTADDRVIVQYRGQTTDGEEFDESYSGPEPATFAVMGVIPGLAEGLQLMPVGSQYRFYIPGPIAYGAHPPPGSPIGPNAVLVFEIELLGIE